MDPDSFEYTYGYLTFYIVFGLLGSLSIALLLHKHHFYYLPESAGAILVGFLVGLAVTVSNLVPASDLVFNSELFFFVLLPPIILEAGYSLKTEPFFRNFGAIVTLAVVGTVLSSFVTAIGIEIGVSLGWFTSGWQGNNPEESLLLGTLLSAVDPVAMLAVLDSEHVGAPVMLYSLVFGESFLNHAVSIVLFNTILPFVESPKVYDGHVIGVAVGNFFLSVTLSILIGIAGGLICSLIFKKVATLADNPDIEFIFMFLFAYGSYSIANWVGYSGILCIFACGLTLGRYAFCTASDTAKWSTTVGFQALSRASEKFVYIYLGLQLSLSCQPRWSNSDYFRWDFPFTIWVLLWCFLSRAVQVFSLISFVNLFRTDKIPLKMQLVMWFGGLRGAIAFALSLNFPMGSNADNLPVVKTVTLSIVILTTFICGGLTEPLVTRLSLKHRKPEEPPPLTGFSKMIQNFDENVIKRFFGVSKFDVTTGFIHDNVTGENYHRISVDPNYLAVRRTTRDFTSRRSTMTYSRNIANKYTF